MKLKNRIAIISGAAKGMGGAISRTLAREGADLKVAARAVEPLEALAAEVVKSGRRVRSLAPRTRLGANGRLGPIRHRDAARRLHRREGNAA